MLRGMVDAEKEVARLQEKIEKLNLQVDKLRKAMSIDGYEEKVNVCDWVWGGMLCLVCVCGGGSSLVSKCESKGTQVSGAAKHAVADS